MPIYIAVCLFLRTTAHSAKHVLAIVVLSVHLGTELSPGETETPHFYRMIALSFCFFCDEIVTKTQKLGEEISLE